VPDPSAALARLEAAMSPDLPDLAGPTPVGSTPVGSTPVDSTPGGPDLVRPEPPRSWREQLAAVAESLDLAPRRLALGLAAVLVVGLVAWRLLAPADPPAEMQLPFASASGGTGSMSQPSGGQPGGAGAPAAVAAGEGSPTPSPGGGSGPPVPGAPLTSSAVPAELVVHVAGAVAAPGVQRLPGGSRVVDAVEAAGGATAEADVGRINLAVPLQDGQQIYVPRVGESPPAPPPGSSSASAGAGAGPGTGSGGGPGSAAQLVDLNTASADELDTLPGVGPATSSAIIAHREQNGPFTSVDQLLDVRGIGEAKLEQLRPLVTV
jgi:competence protein ComEA